MKKVVVRGPALSQSGYGEHTRFILRSLREYPDTFDVYLVNVNWGQTGWIWEETEEREWIDSILSKTIEFGQQQGQFDVSVQVQIPNEWEQLAPINIGVTAGVETTKISPQWVEGCLKMDKIITISEHAKYALERTEYEAQNTQTGQNFMAKTTCPIEIVGYPVKTIEPANIELDLKHDFNFVTVGTWIIRKNLENTVKWFVEQFFDEPVGLIVKTSIMKNCIQDRYGCQSRLNELLKEYEGRKCEVTLLHGDMSEPEMTALYQHPKVKALVSLSHGEGFGLPLFEAAYNALPVIAPNWSGHTDFLYMPLKDKKGKTKKTAMFSPVSYELKPVQPEAVWDGVIQKDSMWCYPKEWDAKKNMKALLKDYGGAKSKAKKLQKYLQKNLSEDVRFKAIAEIVSGEELVTFDKNEIPKISLITSVYNGDEFIRPFLEDITQQSIFKDKCELVLVNANSPGNEEEVINEYVEKYPNNIVYRKLEEDPGIYGTWNIGVEMATGEFLTNANLDDRKAVNSLERHAKELCMNADIDLVYADLWITNSPNETFENNSSNGRKYNFPPFSLENLKMVNMPHSNPMWRRRVHEKHGFFDAKYRSAGDWELWLRSASQGSKFKKIEDVLGLYYFNPKGISTNPENFGWKREEEKEIYEKYQDIKIED